MNLKHVFVYSLFLLVSLKSCQSQTAAVTLMPVAQQQFFDQNGNPLAFGCVFTYQSGTSNNLATFSDFTGTIQNANPVPLSATGSANIWLQTGQAYTIAVKSNGGTNCSLGTLMYSVDGIIGGTSTTSTIVPSGPTPSFVVVGNIQLFTLTLTQNTVALPVSFVNVQAPAIFTIQLTEDNTGGWTFAWPGNVIGGATIDTAANHTTTETFAWNGTSILPVGSGFTSAGNTSLIGAIYSSNTYSGTNAFSGVNTFSNVGNLFTGAKYSSGSANPASSGIVRLADADTACWRNHANLGDVCISKDVSDNIQIPNGVGIGGTVGTYGGRTTVGAGLAAMFGTAIATSNTANVGTTNLIASAGQSTLYRVSCYVIVTTAAGVSSTLPACNIGWTSFANNTAQTIAATSTSAGNTLTTFGQGTVVIDAKFGTAITYSTSGYASNAANAMTYNIYVRAEAL